MSILTRTQTAALVELLDLLADKIDDGRHPSGNAHADELRRLGNDFSPIDPLSPAPSSQKHSRAYLHHLLRLGERYGETLACLQNMAMVLQTIKNVRKEIDESKKIG
jgi:queuine tRNA-ribosyltransferase